MKCIYCAEESYTPYCTDHRDIEDNLNRFDRQPDATNAVGFANHFDAEDALARNRTPANLRKVIEWMMLSGYHSWAKSSVPEQAHKAMTCQAWCDIGRTSITVNVGWVTTEFYRAVLQAQGDWVQSKQFRVPWNNWPRIRTEVEEQFPIREFSYSVKTWMPKAAKQSSNPHTMKTVRADRYTSELALNRGQIRGGEWVATTTGITDFKNLFEGASQTMKEFGNFGKRYVAPASIKNLETLISITQQTQETKIEACIMLMESIRGNRAIARAFPWRMHTERYEESGLHKYVYDVVPDPMFPDFLSTKTPVQECELWDDWLNHYRPYSQQKIIAATSSIVRYLSWWVDMRVGKTPAAMMLMRKLISEGSVEKFVVVCPAINTYDPWYGELEKQGCFRVCILDEGKAMDEANIASEAYDIYVISYSSLAARLPMMQWYWSMSEVGWTLDETSLIKNPTSKRAKAVGYATEHAKYVFALNGTPLAQGPQDIWAQQYAVDRGIAFGTSFGQFSNKWLERVGQGNKYIVNRDKATLFELKLAGSSIRYLRSEADQFSGKDKNFRYVIMPPTKEIKESTKEILAGFTRDEHDSERAIKENILTVYGHLREACAGYNKYEVVQDSGEYNRVRHPMNPKLVWIRTYLKSNPGQPMIIFSENSEMENWIMEQLEEDGIPYSSVRYKGLNKPMDPQTRKAQIDAFQNGDTRVILLKSVQAKGMTLNRIPAVKAGKGAYPVIVYTQPTWSLIDWEQSQDRAVGTDVTIDPQTGKPKNRSISTMIYVLAIRKSIEQEIIKALRGKKKVAETLLADAARNGYQNPFENMDLAEDEVADEDDIFDAHDFDARYKLGIAPQKRLTDKMIVRADIRYRAKKYGTTMKVQEQRPLSNAAVYLLSKHAVDMKESA